MDITKTNKNKKLCYCIDNLSPREYDTICHAMKQLAESEQRNEITLLAVNMNREITQFNRKGL